MCSPGLLYRVAMPRTVDGAKKLDEVEARDSASERSLLGATTTHFVTTYLHHFPRLVQLDSLPRSYLDGLPTSCICDGVTPDAAD